jgi:hypothetical protein
MTFSRIKARTRPRMGVRSAPHLRSPSHLQHIRSLACCIAGMDGHVCEGPIEAMHVRGGTDGALAVKPSDCWTLPGCSGAHRLQHQIGEQAFQKRFSIDMKAIASALWRRSPHRHKAENR